VGTPSLLDLDVDANMAVKKQRSKARGCPLKALFNNEILLPEELGELRQIFEVVGAMPDEGERSSIPELRNGDDEWAVCIVTARGQSIQFGQSRRMTLQSVTKAFNYGKAVQELGYVHFRRCRRSAYLAYLVHKTIYYYAIIRVLIEFARRCRLISRRYYAPN
jgi:hypothetical protein